MDPIRLPPVYGLRLVREGGSANYHPRIKSPSESFDILQAYMQDLTQEHLVVAMLDSQNRVIGIITVAMGGLNVCHIPIREVFKPAILANSAAIIIAHNHPSGEPTPNAEDVHITRQIVEAGKLLNIDVLDHVIIGHDRWVSLRERGLGF